MCAHQFDWRSRGNKIYGAFRKCCHISDTRQSTKSTVKFIKTTNKKWNNLIYKRIDKAASIYLDTTKEYERGKQIILIYIWRCGGCDYQGRRRHSIPKMVFCQNWRFVAMHPENSMPKMQNCNYWESWPKNHLPQIFICIKTSLAYLYIILHLRR